MTDGSVGAFFIHYSRVPVFERAWAWGVFSPMTDGSVGIGRDFIFYEFRWLDQSVRAWGICLRLKMIGTFWTWSTVLKTCEFGLNLVVFGIFDQFSSDSKWM
jgi:hypothetical protein